MTITKLIGYAKKIFALLAPLILLSASVANAEPELLIEAAYPILPLTRDAVQRITIELTGDDAEEGRSFDLYLSAESGCGVMRAAGASFKTGRVTVRAGERAAIDYSWVGPIPTESAFREKIIASVPDLSLSKSVEFSVGVDLRIADILLPEKIESGRRTAIEVVLHDAFHPDRDIAPLLERVGVTPKLQLDLDFAPSVDQVVAKFVARETRWKLVTAYPGRGFTAGRLGKDIDGRHIWRDHNGDTAAITPPTPGEYRVLARMIAPTGGAALRPFISASFDVSGHDDPAHDLPSLAASTVRILCAIDFDRAARAADEVRAILETGKSGAYDEAAATLGIYAQNAAVPDPIRMLGRGALALTASGAGPDELAAFLRPFLRGYGNYGLLIVLKKGSVTWAARDARGEAITTWQDSVAFDDGRFVIIPFALGDDFAVTFRGKGEATTWTVLPDNVAKAVHRIGGAGKSMTVRAGTQGSNTPNRRF